MNEGGLFEQMAQIAQDGAERAMLRQDRERLEWLMKSIRFLPPINEQLSRSDVDFYIREGEKLAAYAREHKAEL